MVIELAEVFLKSRPEISLRYSLAFIKPIIQKIPDPGITRNQVR